MKILFIKNYVHTQTDGVEKGRSCFWISNFSLFLLRTIILTQRADALVYQS